MDKAELAITDLTGNPVEEAVPGQQYKLIAKVYSDGVFKVRIPTSSIPLDRG